MKLFKRIVRRGGGTPAILQTGQRFSAKYIILGLSGEHMHLGVLSRNKNTIV